MNKFRKVIHYFFQRVKEIWLSLLIFFSILFCLIYAEFSRFIFTDPDSALYLLTTIVQISASIVAIVISLSLLVIQYSASTYSARVVDIFKNDLRLQALIFFNGSSIIFSLIVIRLINASINDYPYFDIRYLEVFYTVVSRYLYLGIKYLEIFYTLALLLSVAAYISLVAYIPYILKMMKPSSIIDVLSEKVDIKNLSSSLYEIGEYKSKIFEDEPRINRTIISLDDDEKDPFLPIIDIIQTSIKRYDYATARYALGEVTNSLFIILIKNPTDEERISGHVFNRILEIWKLALRDNDFRLIKMILIECCFIGRECTYLVKESDLDTNFVSKLKTKVLITLHNTIGTPEVEEKVTQKDFLYTTFLSEYYLKEAFKSIIKIKEEEFAELSIYLIKQIQKIAKNTFIRRNEIKINEQIKVFEKLEGSISELSYFLGDIGIAAINSDSKNALGEVIKTLTYIGERAIDNNLIHSISHILKNLWIIGKESTKKGTEIEYSTVQIVKCLENLASKIDCRSKELSDEAQYQIVEYYKHIKSNYNYETGTKNPLEELKQKVRNDIRDISGYIASIGENAVENNLLDAAKQCLKSLEIIERILRSGTQSRIICQDIENIGQKAINKETTFPLVEDIIKTLYSIGILHLGYLFEWDIDTSKIIEFLNEEYNADLDEEDSQIYFTSWWTITVEDRYNSNLSFSLEIIDRNDEDNALIINNVKNKNIKAFHLNDIEGKHFASNLKIFKIGVIEKSEKAYYEIPNSLGELADPILKYAQNSPTFETLKPFTMIIKCFENFGIISIHLRNKFSLNNIFLPFLFSRANFLVYDLKYSDDSNKPEAEECLYWMVEEVFESLHRIAILSLKYDLIEYSELRQLVDSLKRLKKKYSYMSRLTVDTFEEILEIIKRSELRESECTEIIELIENAIEEFKNENKFN